MKITKKKFTKIICNWIALVFFILAFITSIGLYLLISNVILLVFATLWIKDTEK